MFETLSQSLRAITNKIRFSDDEKSLQNALSELKKILLRSDVHHKVVKQIIQDVQHDTKSAGIGKVAFKKALENSLLKILENAKGYGFSFAITPPTIVLMMGLQGSGKTTTSAKLANYLKLRNKKVLLCACDLQRLGAVAQLQQLGDSIEIPVFSLESKSAVEVAMAAKDKAVTGQYDVLIIDSAGRLSIDEELMSQLKEIKRLLKPHASYYVADSLSGQDGVRSAESFNTQIGIDGVVLSKFDSDSKGGIALNIAYQIGVPLRFIGHGEKIADLDIFMPERIVSRIMGEGDIITLAEKTANIIDEKEAKQISSKIKKGQFGFMDFLAQVENIKKLGSLSSIVSMLPGLGNLSNMLKNVDLDNSSGIKNIRAMVDSMTPKERENPALLNGSRRARIARGSGLEVADINRIIKQFDQASKMAKKIGQKGGMQEMMNLMNNARFK